MTSVGPFRDRRDAGRLLAQELRAYAGRDDVLVLGLPRGGVPVAAEVARALRLPLDAFVVRKLGAPGQEELAMGAVGSGGAVLLNDNVIAALAVPRAQIDEAIARERRELERREWRYRDGRPFPALAQQTVLLVDDGAATGASMQVAVGALRRARPAQIVAALPVASEQACATLRATADVLYAVIVPEPFGGVGAWYLDFAQVADDEVRALLQSGY